MRFSLKWFNSLEGNKRFGCHMALFVRKLSVYIDIWQLCTLHKDSTDSPGRFKSYYMCRLVKMVSRDQHLHPKPTSWNHRQFYII